MNALVLAPFQPEALRELRGKMGVAYESWMDTRKLLDPEELIRRIEADDLGIIILEADFLFDDVLDNASRLRFIGICRAATGNVDIEAANRHGILVVNAPGRNAVSVAELTVGLMLSLARRIPPADSFVRSGKWEDPVEAYLSLRGIELAGKTAGLVGFGAVGSQVSRRLSAFDMRVLAFDPFVSPELMEKAGAEPAELSELVKQSDFVSLHCTASPETLGLISAELISLMKPTACLVNTAGWDIVDSSALLEALQQRRIAGAAFDIYESHPVPPDSPFLKLNNVVLTPHIGGATDGTIDRYSQMIVNDIDRFLAGQRPQHLVNPAAWQAVHG